MICQESSAVDLLPNGTDDGGFGLCHMQPSVARDFGLTVYADCKELVCREHGKALRVVLEQHNYDRKKVIKFDERLHPIKNIDAVGRMLTVHSEGKKIAGLGPFRTALCRYAGKYNYQKYWKNVRQFMDFLSDSVYLQKLERRFNDLNPNLKINGKPANFKIYITICQEQNYNYGLAQYEKGTKYLPKNSIDIMKSYRSFL